MPIKTTAVRATFGTMLAALLMLTAPAIAQDGAKEAYLVQGGELAALKRAIVTAGGDVTHEFTTIKALGVVLTEEQRARVAQIHGVRLVVERTLRDE